MDRFFVQFLLLPEGAMIALAMASLVVGAVLAGVFIKVRTPMRRVSYLATLAGLSLGVAGLPYAWLAISAMAEFGLLWLVVVAVHLGVAAFGALTYLASAARSVDITGKPGKAWLGFVPLANLWLMFRAGDHGSNDNPPKGWMAALDPLVVLLALGAMIGAKILEARADEVIDRHSGNAGPALIALVTDAQTVQQSFETEVESLQSILPIQINEDTTLVSARTSGKTLFYVYDVTGIGVELVDGLRHWLALDYCQPDMFGPALKKGGEIVFNYHQSDGILIEAITLTGADCPKPLDF
ncbi:hypothetical protein [Tropicibacter oceani]|uniref:DUF805 domain-containing protein n=1 Tax=Tropicibacter oceani TaxID=3058420 RepID=A0ABY8QEP8_9RHOB|nr:hypothetical protein [Tropicibacter oceani]WGW02262.1 hypothetical protein QF118_09855 [Tropicibacter oceani]